MIYFYHHTLRYKFKRTISAANIDNGVGSIFKVSKTCKPEIIHLSLNLGSCYFYLQYTCGFFGAVFIRSPTLWWPSRRSSMWDFTEIRFVSYHLIGAAFTNQCLSNKSSMLTIRFSVMAENLMALYVGGKALSERVIQSSSSAERTRINFGAVINWIL